MNTKSCVDAYSFWFRGTFITCDNLIQNYTQTFAESENNRC